jgi:hypothetical protein
MHLLHANDEKGNTYPCSVTRVHGALYKVVVDTSDVIEAVEVTVHVSVGGSHLKPVYLSGFKQLCLY